jgi:hypothetical protein
MSFIIDRDSLGKIKAPSDAHYNAFKAGAREQYRETGNDGYYEISTRDIIAKTNILKEF